jgi:hypothetical protein
VFITFNYDSTVERVLYDLGKWSPFDGYGTCVDLRGRDLSGANLQGGDFTGASFREANLFQCGSDRHSRVADGAVCRDRFNQRETARTAYEAL